MRRCDCPRQGNWLFCPWCGERLRQIEQSQCTICDMLAWRQGGKYCRAHSPALQRSVLDRVSVTREYVAGKSCKQIALELGFKCVPVRLRGLIQSTIRLSRREYRKFLREENKAGRLSDEGLRVRWNLSADMTNKDLLRWWLDGGAGVAGPVAVEGFEDRND